jgi:hypothetical protein
MATVSQGLKPFGWVLRLSGLKPGPISEATTGATAKAKEEADSRRELQKERQGQRQKRKKKQIPGGNDRKKGKGKNEGNSRFPEGMTAGKARATAKANAGVSPLRITKTKA